MPAPSETAHALAQLITQQLHDAFAPVYFELHNDSHQHATLSDTSHFRVLIVSNHFTETSRVKRHKMVYATLAEMIDQIHALAIQAYTPAEWAAHPDNRLHSQSQSPNSARTPPQCAKH